MPRPLSLLPALLLVVSLMPATAASATESAFAQVTGDPVRLAGGPGDNANFASISSTGEFIVLMSALPLTPSAGDDGGNHVFVYNVAAGTYEQIDVLANGRSSETIIDRGFDSATPRITPDGRYVAFASSATDLDPAAPEFDNFNGDYFLYLRDRQTSTTTLVSINGDDEVFDIGGFTEVEIDLSADGNVVAYEHNLNRLGFCGSPGVNAVYTWNRGTGNHTLVSADGENCIADGHSRHPRVSADGSLVVFQSEASDVGGIAATGTNIWTGSFTTGEYENLTADADADSTRPSVSGNGQLVAFETLSGSYDPDDTNFRKDIYVRNRSNNTTTLVSIDPGLGGTGSPGPEESFGPEISDSGNFIVFASENELIGPDQPSEAGDQSGVYQIIIDTPNLGRVDQPPSSQLSLRGFQGAAQDVADNGTTVFASSADNLDDTGNGGLFFRLGTGTAPPPPSGPTPEDGAIEAAIGVSAFRFQDRVPAYGVLATINNFADALSGAVLSQQGPLLLTSGTALDPRTLAEFNRVLGGTGTIYVLGGTSALSAEVAAALTGAGYTVQRLSGGSRFETSTAIAAQARTLFGDTGEVALARAFGPEGNPTAAWADSVTGGGYAADTGTPIILTPSDSVHPAVQAFLDGDTPQTVHLLGGRAALNDSFDSLAGARRTAGATRSDTARQIALQLWEQPEEGVRAYLILDATNELGWAYGLPASGLSADADAPILATSGTTNPPETLAAVVGCDDQVVTAAISPLGAGLLDELRTQDDAPC